MEEIPPGEHLSPFESQRQLHAVFAQETRHRIIQTILGHPAHLPSLAELAYYTQKSESAVLDQLGQLEEFGLVETYDLDEGRHRRDLPGTFYGFTERGVLLLDRFEYLRGIPMLQAVHEQTAKTERIRRHEDAPRPDLPEPVAAGLEAEDDAAPGAELSRALAAETDSLRDLF
ncbi:winged helix-turn-helix domain-containing protein [Halovenus carboxidivorans]|uniref:winged helix-turn-helix domain-containing protein n=1 Tax=Halovenus carboxidivorans TaxID=2692199 RepID=UPI001915AA42|nr:winged helix-turn-helix domain-containing protein [Halovenus carboxidivorans]